MTSENNDDKSTFDGLTNRSEEPENSTNNQIISPNQLYLSRTVELINQFVSGKAIISASLNSMDEDLACLVIDESLWKDVALLLRTHPELHYDYLRNISGVDHETHLEVVYHMISFEHDFDLCIKVNTNREKPSIFSVTEIWPTANWQEREAYDLLGISFANHPDLRRIMMPDDWVGYPLRKDYEPIDPEV